MMKQLSIIVPVYNAERWLHRCVDSLLNQDLPREDYEIILVDDGSNDGSSKICDEYLAAHPGLVRVIHQPNSGVSMARNAALDVAVGDYVMFVDADDFIEHNCLQRVAKKTLGDNAEVCFYKNKIITSNGETIRDNNLLSNDKVCAGDYYILHGGDMSSIWRSLYSRELIEKLKLRFYPNITHQDVLFNFQILPFVERIAFSDVLVYNYVYEGESLTRTKSVEKIKYNIYNDFVVACEINEYAAKLQSLELQEFYTRHANSMLVSLFYRLFVNKRSWGKDFCSQCVNMCINRGAYPISGRTLSWKTTALIPLMNCRWIVKLLIK